MLNTCYNAVDRHVERGRGKQRAIIYDSPVTGVVQIVHLRELRDEVARLAGALRALGLEKGDRVIIYMPGVPEAIFAMLACARLGAIHSVVFGGFASKELATRIDDAQAEDDPDGVMRHRGRARHPVQAAARSGDRPGHAQAGDLRGAAASAGRGDARRRARSRLERRAHARPSRRNACRSTATDPLYIHYTSGTTGIPKGVVRDNGGHAVALKWSMANVFSVGPGEVFWAASDIGWTVGHGYIVYGPLLHGATTILYEGKPVGTPDAGAFWRVCEQHGVNVLFTAPTAFRAIKREDPEGRFMRAARSVALPPAVSRRRTLRSRHAASGPPSGSASRSSITGGRPSWAGRRLPTAPASACCR